jgi:hypothetical protein
MTRSLIGIALGIALTGVVSPVRAQAPQPQWPWPQQAYIGSNQPAPLVNAPTPGDAYKQGLINRWELERLEGPTPQAMQGPSPDGGNQGGGDRNGN